MKKMKALLNKINVFPYYDLLFSLFFVLVGICMIVFPSTTIYIASVLCGILLLAFALQRFLLLFSTRERSVYFLILFFINLLSLLGALALIFFSRAAVGIIGFFIGCILIVDAVKRLYVLLVLSSHTPKTFALPICMCTLTILFGIFLVFAPNAAAGITSILCGIALIVESVQSAVFFFLDRRHERRKTDDYIETDFEDKT